MRKIDWGNHAVEFVLVIAGILVALAIDNWNSERKDRLHEYQLLTQIHQDLQRDLETVNEVLTDRNITLGAFDALQKLLRGGVYDAEVAEPAMISILQLERIAFRRGAYEVLRFSGLRLTNSALRISLSDYYEYSTPLANESVQDIEYSFITSWVPLAERVAGTWSYGKVFTAKDPQAFMTDERLSGLLIVERDNTYALLVRLGDLKQEIEQLLAATEASYRKLAP